MSTPPHQALDPSPSGPLIITIDGPAGVGKGTLCHNLAKTLNLPLLDSGSIYRLVALIATREGVQTIDDEAALRILEILRRDAYINFSATGAILTLGGEDVSSAIRTETISQRTSQISIHPKIREGLTPIFQAALAKGGIAEGRDMGSVVFPNAQVKIYLTAAIEERAQRRHHQLCGAEVSDRQSAATATQDGLPSIDQIREEIAIRDTRDSTRLTGPLKVPEGATVIDSTHRSKEETLQEAMRIIRSSGLING